MRKSRRTPCSGLEWRLINSPKPPIFEKVPSMRETLEFTGSRWLDRRSNTESRRPASVGVGACECLSHLVKSDRAVRGGRAVLGTRDCFGSRTPLCHKRFPRRLWSVARRDGWVLSVAILLLWQPWGDIPSETERIYRVSSYNKNKLG